MKHVLSSHLQKGLSLIELMVAMTLGLMIVSTLGYILMGSSSTYRTQDASARVQDTGRFALEFIGRQIRAAGRVAITPLACDTRVNMAGVDPVQTTSTSTSLSVQYQDTDMGRTLNTIPDCNGSAVTAGIQTICGGPNHYVTVIDTISRDGQRQLQCNGNGGGSQPFAEGVEELQFRYTTGNGVWAATPTNPVAAVEVCIMVRSLNAGAVPTAQKLSNCAGVSTQYADTFLRRTFTSVFAVRNNISTLPN